MRPLRLGVVAPGAVGVERFRALLDEGRSAIAEIDRFDTAGLGAHTAAVVRDFKARDFIAPMKLRRMNPLSPPMSLQTVPQPDSHGAEA